MIDNNTLLERMVSISPAAHLHLTGKLWQQHIDEDDITPQQLVLECFSMMVDEAYDLGIEFYCTRADLCDSFYHLDKVLLLFEVVFPTPLYRSITEDPAFKRFLTSVVVDGVLDPEDSSIMTVLNYLAYENPSTMEMFLDTYTFLQDKMLSTPIFDVYARGILDTDNTPFETPVDTATLTSYIDYIVGKVARLIKAVDVVRLEGVTNTTVIQTQYNRVDIYKVNATTADTLAKYAWVHQNLHAPELTPLEQSLIVRFTQEFDTITPFYESYFKMRGTALGLEDILSLVLGCFDEADTSAAFTAKIDATLDRLRAIEQPSPLETTMLVQRTALALIREFYT